MTEPAVVHNKHFNAELGRFLCDGYELVGIEIEICCLPVVDKHGTALVLVFASDKVSSVKVMECSGHLSDTLGAVYHNDLGSGECFAAFEKPCKIEVVYTHNSTCFLVLSYLCLSKEVSAVYEVESVSFAYILICIMRN